MLTIVIALAAAASPDDAAAVHNALTQLSAKASRTLDEAKGARSPHAPSEPPPPPKLVRHTYHYRGEGACGFVVMRGRVEDGVGGDFQRIHVSLGEATSLKIRHE